MNQGMCEQTKKLGFDESQSSSDWLGYQVKISYSVWWSSKEISSVDENNTKKIWGSNYSTKFGSLQKRRLVSSNNLTFIDHML